MSTTQTLRHPAAAERTAWRWLIGFVVLAIAARAGVAILFPTIERPDEIFQNLEPAHRIWTGYGIISWEWRVGIRSWIFPAALSGLMSLVTLLHLPPSAALPLIWTVLSVVSAGVVAVGVSMGWRLFGVTGALLCGILTALWPDLVYFGPKTLGEVQAGNLLVVAAALAAPGPARRAAALAAPDAARSGSLRLFASGVLLGLAFALRFQLAIPLLVVACWGARLDFRRSWPAMLLGAAIPLVLLGAVDWWTLGSPFQSVWKNIQVNLFEHKAAGYGVQPFYRYLTLIVFRNGAASVALLACFLYGMRSAPLLALTAVIVIAFHSLISHKEVSFVYAAAPCAIVVAGLGAARFVDNLQVWLRHPPSPRLARAVAAGVALATVVSVVIAERPFTAPPQTAAFLNFFRLARSAPDLCGLGVVEDVDTLWAYMGGYAYLDRRVPIFLARTPEAIAESRSGFNYVISPRAELPLLTGYDPVLCRDGYCLLHRPSPCAPTTAHEISSELTTTTQ